MVFSVLLGILLLSVMGIRAQAKNPEFGVTIGDYKYDIYYDGGTVPTSIWIVDYVGTDTQVIIPSTFVKDGNTYPVSGHELDLGNAFKGKSKIQKIAITNGIGYINGTFEGCTSLSEVALGDSISYISQNAFAGLPNLKTYRINGSNLETNAIKSSGIGRDTNGNIYAGITVYTKQGSKVDKEIQEINAGSSGNKIALVYEADPYSKHTVKPQNSSSGNNGGNTGGNTSGSGNRLTQRGSDGTSLGKGASYEAAENYLQSFGKETDPPGTVFGLLQLKASKVTKNSIKLQWKKVSGARKYIVYGNKCGKKNKYVKQVATTKTSLVIKKISSKRIKKGTYYKFILVALDKNNDIISTSRTVHAASSGGKPGNSKSVFTKAKKNKVVIKVKKKFKLAAKDKPVSALHKVQHHRKICYESTNKAVAAVSKKGVITGKKKGKCTIYAYAQNGVFCKVKVTVK